MHICTNTHARIKTSVGLILDTFKAGPSSKIKLVNIEVANQIPGPGISRVQEAGGDCLRLMALHHTAASCQRAEDEEKEEENKVNSDDNLHCHQVCPSRSYSLIYCCSSLFEPVESVYCGKTV